MASGGSRGLGRRTLLRNALVTACVLVCLAFVVATVFRSAVDQADARKAADAYTPPPLSTPSPAPLPVVAIIGDDTTSEAGSDVVNARRWTALLARDSSVDVQPFASTDAGYSEEGADGRSFRAQASRVPADSAVVLIFGGARDIGRPALSESRAASQTISAVQRRAPDATIVVVGPVTSGGAGPTSVTRLRTNLQNIAASFGIRFIDPIQQAWLNGSPARGADLNAADQAQLAAQFGVVLKQVLSTS